MSASSSRSPGTAAGDIPELPGLTVLRLEGTERRALIPAPQNYVEALRAAKDAFAREARLDDIRLFVNMQTIGPHFRSDDVEITASSWPIVLKRLEGLTPELGVRVLPRAAEDPTGQRFPLALRTLVNKTFTVEVTERDTVLAVKEKLHHAEEVPPEICNLWFETSCLRNERALREYGIGRDAKVYLIYSLRNSRAGKPGIYLFSPAPLQASVRLSLVGPWSFSSVFPSTEIVYDAGDQNIQWDVEVRKDCLVNLATGHQEACLRWLAQANPQRPDSPPASRPGSPVAQTPPLAFDPFDPVIEPENSVVLPVAEAPVYLRQVLAALHLAGEARTSFIFHWLPDITKHKHIALRFLSQEEYEQVARLDISPTPAAVTRVFMLFRGLLDEDARTWRAASMSADNPSYWKRVVGVQDCAADETLYRALEWGGMEVHG